MTSRPEKESAGKGGKKVVLTVFPDGRFYQDRGFDCGHNCDCFCGKELVDLAFSNRVRPLVEALERIEQRTLRDAEGPELRCQNENNYRDAHEALEEFKNG